MNTIEQILDLARWAPSGDNEQPWRFEIVDDSHFVVHGHDTSDWCVYDLDGRASQIAIGALLQTIEIAASEHNYQATFSRRQDIPDNTPTIDVYLTKDESHKISNLLPYIKKRTTQRRPLSTRTLTPHQKSMLEEAVGNEYKVIWLEGRKKRWQMAKLLFRSAYIRLTIPEAYEVHKKNIEWNAQFSEDRIPDQAIGVDTLTLKAMRWTLKSWKRVQMMNKYFAGTLLPRLQMDLLPGYCCAAHFLLLANKPLGDIDDYLEGGKAVQRFWLTTTSLELQLQPEMTPLIFSKYSTDGTHFTNNNTGLSRSIEIVNEFDNITHKKSTTNRVFMGRIGNGSLPTSRSIRLPISNFSLRYQAPEPILPRHPK